MPKSIPYYHRPAKKQSSGTASALEVASNEGLSTSTVLVVGERYKYWKAGVVNLCSRGRSDAHRFFYHIFCDPCCHLPPAC